MKHSSFVSTLLVVITLCACNSTSTPTPSPVTNTANCQGIAGYELVSGTTALNKDVSKQLIVKCPAGKNVISAGWAALDSTDAILDGKATYSMPSYDGKEWMVNAAIGTYQTTPNWKLKVTCICADTCQAN